MRDPLILRDGRTAHLRSMTGDDLPFVAGQHLRHFPDGFFARLGPRFLCEYYRTFLTSATARTVVAELDGRPAISSA